MNNINLEENTQAEVREFMQKTMATREKQAEFDKFFTLIAPSLKLKVQNHIFTETLSTNAVINKLIVKLRAR